MADKKYRKTFTVDGVRYYVRGSTKKELAEKEIEKREEIKNGIVDKQNPKLDDYYKHFTRVRRSEVSESTLRAQQSQFKIISEVEISQGETFGSMRMKDITPKDIEYVRLQLLDDGKTPENLNTCFAHLKHVFNTAVYDETIEKNPCRNMKKLKRESQKVGDTIHRALTLDETKKFFKAARERNSFYLNVFSIMIKTGMRIGEVTALYPSDIDEVNGCIHVRKTITRDEVGGYKVGDSAKTECGNRDIPLTDEILDIINQQKLINSELFGEVDNGLIFRSSEGEILREYTLNREIRRVCIDADIDYFTSHAFRNTFATRFIEQSPHEYKILSDIIGHSDVTLTLNLYTHVMKDNKVKAMNSVSIDTGVPKMCQER